MPNCEQCSKSYHHCGSCGTGHDPDAFFCSGTCEQAYSDANGITKIGEFLRDVFEKHVSGESQKQLIELLHNTSGELDYMLIIQELRSACYTAPKTK